MRRSRRRAGGSGPAASRGCPWADGRFATPSGRFIFPGRMDDAEPVLGTEDVPTPPHRAGRGGSMNSQILEAEQDGPLIAGVSPSAAAHAGLGDGEMAALVSPRGRLEVRLRCDATLRPDIVALPKGGWHKHGRNMNVLIEPRFTAGTGSAFNENSCVSKKSDGQLSPTSGSRRAPPRVADVRIGISGWRYAPWRGVFYPTELPQERELEYAVAAAQLDRDQRLVLLPPAARRAISAWYDATPDDFVFAVKGGRFITHMKKLKDVETPLANFFASGVLRLKEKLGPILWQFPPSSRSTRSGFDAFFELLPRDDDGRGEAREAARRPR